MHMVCCIAPRGVQRGRRCAFFFETALARLQRKAVCLRHPVPRRRAVPEVIPRARAVCWAKAGCGTAAAGQAQAAAAGSPASSPPAHASGAPTSPLGGRASSQSARRHAAANHTVNHARKQAAARTPAPCADGRGGGAPAAACGSAGDAAPGAAALAGSPPSFAGCGLGRRGGQADREAEAAAALGLRCKLGSGPGSTERSSGPFRNTIASGACRPLDVCTQLCAV